jgi:hypothetical protein
MAKRLDPKVAEAVMLNAGLKPLEPYKGAVAKWKCLHIPCGEVVYAQYNMIQNGRGGCKKCGNESRFAKSRLTQKEVDLRLKEKGLVPLENYFNSSTAFDCKCIKCGNIQSVKFRNINKTHGCAKCGLKLGGLKGRVTQNKAIETMKLLDLEPLEPYVLSDKKWKCRCLRCGGVVFPTYGDATQGKRGCKKCGYEASGMKSRIPEKQAIAILKKAGLEPLEPYRNSHVRWKCKCLKCGKKTSPMLATISHKNGGCRFCAPNAPIDVNKALRIMKKARLNPLEPFKNGTSKWKSECLRCGRVVHPSFSKVQTGQMGCRHCGNIVTGNKLRTPEKVAVAIMLKAQLRPLKPYVGDGEKWESECLKCGNIVFPMLTNIKQNNGGCMFCAMKGIDFNKPAYLYLLTHLEFGAFKVGVGNSQAGKKNDRIKRLQKFGWEVHKRWDFETGAEAFGIEQNVLNYLRKDLGLPIYLTLDLMKDTGGHTETIDADSITLLELEKNIKKIIKGHRKNP